MKKYYLAGKRHGANDGRLLDIGRKSKRKVPGWAGSVERAIDGVVASFLPRERDSRALLLTFREAPPGFVWLGVHLTCFIRLYLLYQLSITYRQRMSSISGGIGSSYVLSYVTCTYTGLRVALPTN